MDTKVARIRKRIRRIASMVLAAMIIATSLSYAVTATENNSEQELAAEQEEEPEQRKKVPIEDTNVSVLDYAEGKNLTLITCTPFMVGTHRLIVHAIMK